MTGIGYLILISLDFCDFISPFSFLFKFWWRRYIKHERQCLTTFPNASEFVKNTPQHVLFSTLFSVLACGQTCSFSSGQIVIVSSSGTLVNSERTSKEPIYSPLWLYVHKVTACGFSCLIYYVKYCLCNTFSFLFQLVTAVRNDQKQLKSSI